MQTVRQPGLYMNAEGVRLSDSEQVDSGARKIESFELHLVVGCSDARDVSLAFNASVGRVRREYANKGILVSLVRENVAGTVITKDVADSLKARIRRGLRKAGDLYSAGVPIRVFVHLLAHGEVNKQEGAAPELKFTVHELSMVQGSSYNCGMMHAGTLAQEFEKEILLDKPVLCLPDFARTEKREFKIDNQEHLRDFMQCAYGVRTTISSGYVHSIVNLPRHAAFQKQALREALSQDEFKLIKINITAGVQDYGKHEYYRVDGNTHLYPTFLDEVFRVKHGMFKRGEIPDQERLIAAQKPSLGLFHHSEVEHPRATAVELHTGEKYSASMVFAIGSGLADHYERGFGPYRVIAFYYGVTHLKLKNWVVMGRTGDETRNIRLRIMNDPLISWVIQKHGVELHCYSQDSLTAEQHKKVHAFDWG